MKFILEEIEEYCLSHSISDSELLEELTKSTWETEEMPQMLCGALIGGLLGTQVCGEEKIVGNKCQDVAVFYATISGAVLGYATEALMGNHDGFQYVIDVDNQEDDVRVPVIKPLIAQDMDEAQKNDPD